MATLPTHLEVSKALELMLRRAVKVTVSKTKLNNLNIAGSYSSNNTAPTVAVCFVDLGFAANSAAAFSMIHADEAKDCVKAKALSEMLQDNFGEVLNVFSRLFGEQDNKRIMLTAKHFPPAPLPEGLTKSLAATDNKLDLDVEIEGYGKGVIALRLI